MTASASQYPTYVDHQNRVNPMGGPAKVVELLSTKRPWLRYLPFKQGNLPNGEQFTVRTSEPTGSWREANQGVAPEKSTTAQATIECGHLESYSETDQKIYNLPGNGPAYRATEDAAFVRGLGKTIADTIVYGNAEKTPASFNGIMRYYTGNGASRQNIISAGGTGTDNASVLLCSFAEDELCGVYPQNGMMPRATASKGVPPDEGAGSSIRDFALRISATVGGDSFSANRKIPVYTTQYVIQMGICLKDWRSVVRIANIDREDIEKDKDATNSPDLQDLMIQAEVMNQGEGRMFLFADKFIMGWLRRQMVENKSEFLSWDQIGGSRMMVFGDGISLVRDDTMEVQESAVTIASS